MPAAAALTQPLPQIRIDWTTPVSDTLSGPYVTAGDFSMLGDSSVVFTTRQYESIPGPNSKPVAYYLSKINAAGQLVVDRKKIQLPSASFYIKSIDFTTDGGVIILALKDRVGLPQTKTDSAILIKFNATLAISWQRFISNQDAGGSAPSRVTGLAALTDGRIMVGYNKREEPRGPRELPGTLSLLTCFGVNGDSIYTHGEADPILDIQKLSDAAFLLTKDYDLSDDVPELHSSVDGSYITAIVFALPSNTDLVSTLTLMPATQQLVGITHSSIVSYPYDGPNDYSLHVTDAVLHGQYQIDYKNVSLFKGRLLTLIKDREKGMYVFQSLQANPFFGNTDYFALCRLDSSGKGIWAIAYDKPAAALGGIPFQLMPLAANDFIMLGQTTTGYVVARITAEMPPPGVANSLVPVQTSTKKLALAESDVPAGDLSVNLIGNPSTNSFTFISKSNSNEPLTVWITDIQGRVLEKRSGVPANGVFQMGYTVQPGIYIASLVQSGKVITLKMVKEK